MALIPSLALACTNSAQHPILVLAPALFPGTMVWPGAMTELGEARLLVQILGCNELGFRLEALSFRL